jgi:hypothetical protein
LSLLSGLDELVHHLADVGNTSAAFGIFGRALASTHSFFGQNFFHNRGLAVLPQIDLNIFIGVMETIAN